MAMFVLYPNSAGVTFSFVPRREGLSQNVQQIGHTDINDWPDMIYELDWVTEEVWRVKLFSQFLLLLSLSRIVRTGDLRAPNWVKTRRMPYTKYQQGVAQAKQLSQPNAFSLLFCAMVYYDNVPN